MRLLYLLMMLTVSVCTALAQGGPNVVVPGRPDVPVFIDGVDASWSVVEGDFGLDRPGMRPVIIYGPFRRVSIHARPPRRRHYFPMGGRPPHYGRLEKVPHISRRPPRLAPSFHQSWSVESTPEPVGPPSPVYAPGGLWSSGTPSAGLSPGPVFNRASADQQPVGVPNDRNRLMHQGSNQPHIRRLQRSAGVTSFDHPHFTTPPRSTSVGRALTPLSTSRPLGGFVRGHR